MGALIIDDTTKKAAEGLAKFATAKENWYHVNESKWVPGDRPEYVLNFLNYRTVFTITVLGDKICRHMSVSVPTLRKFAHPITVFTICTMLGFTGGVVDNGITTKPGEDWSMVSQHTPRSCVIVAQPYEAEDD